MEPCNKNLAPSTKLQFYFKILLSFGFLSLFFLAFYQCLPGLNPSSLWLDDLWVAYLVKSASIPYIFLGKTIAPPGFILILKLVTAFLGNASWKLQLIPLAAYFAQILVIYWLVHRVTRNQALGFLAATLLAANPTLALYSLRVKQFSLDSLISLVLLSLAVSCLERPRARIFLQLCITSLTVLLFSFTSIFLSVILINLLLYHFLRTLPANEKGAKQFILLSGVVCNLAIGVLYIIFISQRHTYPMFVYWTKFYLPANDFHAAITFLTHRGHLFVSRAFPPNLSWLALLIPVGLYALIKRPGQQAIGWGLLLFYIEMVVVSAAKTYPLGGIRTDIFSYPISIFSAIFGLWALTKKNRTFAAAAAIIALCFFANEVTHRQVHYPKSNAKAVVQKANITIREEDGLIVYPWTNWAAGYYGTWPTEIVDVTDSVNGFYVHLIRPRTLVLHETYNGIEFNSNPLVVQSQLPAFLAAKYYRIFYISTTTSSQAHAWIIGYILKKGYRVQIREKLNNADFIIFERNPNR